VRRSLFCGVVPPRRISFRLIREVTSAVAFSVTSSAGKRVFVELEHDVTRVRQAETRFRYRQDSTVQTPLGTSVVTERIHPTWTTLRMGLELPWP
jgi:hypothetical protein